MTQPLIRLVYCSRSVHGGGPADPEAEIRAILAVSRRNNVRDGITGALLFSDGCFAQVLEGGADQVERTFERIQLDPRHADTLVLRVDPIVERDFGDWSMGHGGHDRSDALRCLALDQVFREPQAKAGSDIVAVLRDLMARQVEWA